MLATLLDCWKSPLLWIPLNLFLVFATWLPRSQASPYDAKSVPVYECPYPASPDEAQHEKFLNGLNGTRIVFIGDSITRYQYITLAAFLAKGVCPGTEDQARSREYSDLYHPRAGWNEFYRDSSRALNTNRSVETCFCEETKTMPEYRTYVYRDRQTNMEPTHVVINYGHWLTQTADRDCGYGTEGRARLCPQIADICEFLNGKHPFRVIWQTTTPRFNIGDSITDVHLHIPHACNMNPKNVLHRGLVVAAVEPVNKKRHHIFHDLMHFSPIASHAFNGALFEMIVNGWSMIKLG